MDLWEKKPWAQRRMWVYYRLLQDEKKRRHEEKSVREAEQKRNLMSQMPKERKDRPGVRY